VNASRPLADERSLEMLDFGAIRAMLARETATERAAAHARELTPHAGLAQVREEQTATSEMRTLVASDPFDLPRVVDVAAPIERAARGATLSAEELRDAGVALAAADAAVRRVRGDAGAPTLIARCAAAAYLARLTARIDEAIDDRGVVLDRASPALGRIRRQASKAQEEARERCQAMVRSARYAKAIQEPIVTLREGRFVIPVKAEFAGTVPGVVHDTSASGHTLFIEPLGALEVNNRFRALRIEEAREVTRILGEISALLGREASQARANLDVLADIDLVLSRVRVAERMRATAPELVAEARVRVVDGRHPLLGERAVPQSLNLDDATRFVVISGPNMGGKTVALKMLGLFVAMAYCGLQLPTAEGTVIGDFETLGCDIGDEQSIAENTSTFSAHLARVRTLLETAGPRALVLIDEIATGTEPAASAALAIALLEALLAAGARGVVTTHAGEVKLFAHATAGLQNASVRFDAASYVPTYQLDVGSPGQSLAFPLARSLGIDAAVVARAETLLGEGERDYERALGELAGIRSEAAAERDAAAKERLHLASLQENARRRAEGLERERRRIAQQAEERLTQTLRDFAAELERRSKDRGPARARTTPGQHALLGRVLDEVHRDLGLVPQKPAQATSTAVSIGDGVIVESLGGEGTVVDDYGETLLVALGSLRTVVPKSGVTVTRRASLAPGGKRRAGETAREAAAEASTELDVRGKRFMEAEPLVDRWLDEAHLLEISPLRLIHGKGTGLLGRGLHEYLKGHAAVKSFRYGNMDEGGSGVTVIELT
jgi:DNA mismatch repair protein MutS2